MPAVIIACTHAATPCASCCSDHGCPETISAHIGTWVVADEDDEDADADEGVDETWPTN